MKGNIKDHSLKGLSLDQSMEQYMTQDNAGNNRAMGQQLAEAKSKV